MSDFDPSRLNGMGGASPVPLITPAAKFEFNEMMARALIAQVKKIVGQSGGQVPINDPASVLILGVILDKLAALESDVAEIKRTMPLAEGFGRQGKL